MPSVHLGLHGPDARPLGFLLLLIPKIGHVPGSEFPRIA
jgi:hypothetical protein